MEGGIFESIGKDMVITIFKLVWPYEAELRATCRYFRGILSKYKHLMNLAAEDGDVRAKITLDILKNSYLNYTCWGDRLGDGSKKSRNISNIGNIRQVLAKYIVNYLKIIDHWENINSSMINIEKFAEENSRFGLTLKFEKVVSNIDKNLFTFKGHYRCKKAGYKNITYKNRELNYNLIVELFRG